MPRRQGLNAACDGDNLAKACLGKGGSMSLLVTAVSCWCRHTCFLSRCTCFGVSRHPCCCLQKQRAYDEMQRTMRFDETPVASKSAVPLTAKNLAYAQLAAGSESRLQRDPSKLSMASGRPPRSSTCAGSSKHPANPPAPLVWHCQCMYGKATALLQTLLLASQLLSHLGGHTLWLTWTQLSIPGPCRCGEQRWQRRQRSFGPQHRGGRQKAHPAADRSLQQGTGAPAGAAGEAT